ncbi:MAG: proteasome accessory factor PafA2 family protein [Candidatus Sungiibacteriota bacterium]
MKEALMGLETEYGIYCDVARLKSLLGGVENYVNVVLKQVPKILPENDYCMAYKSTGEFWTRAGMRLYPDRGTHLEVATGECGTFSELIFQKNAGDCLASALVNKARKVLRAHPYGYDGPFEIYANNTAVDAEKFFTEHSKSEATFSRHENYLLRKDLFTDAFGGRFSYFDFIFENDGHFFAARPLLGGAGHITLEGKFVLSPRMHWTARTVGGGTTHNRALVNTRDEPHADGQKFLRYHHIAGDTNITDHITKMKMAFTYWVLRLLERGWKAPDWLRIDGTRASESALMGVARDINGDPQLGGVHSVGGRNCSAADILMSYLEAVDKHREKLLFEAEDDEIFLDVASYLERAKAGFESLAGESEWATKYDLMLREMRKKKIRTFNDSRLKKLSIVLHNLDRNPDENPFAEFRARVLPPNMEISDLGKACRQAPKTRAFVRGLAVYLAKRFGVAITFPTGAEWVSLSTPADPDGILSTLVSLNRMTPWEITKDDVEKVVRHMRQVAMICPKGKSKPAAQEAGEPFYGV